MTPIRTAPAAPPKSDRRTPPAGTASAHRRRALREYWETRLALPDRFTGPGYRALGAAYNRWLYRVRGEAFRDLLLPRLGPLAPGVRVLDLGSGTGFYLDCWQAAGVAPSALTAVELTEAGARRLTHDFPCVTVRRGDLTEPSTYDGLPPMDVVSAMDVFYHLMDDDGYAQALRQIRSVLRPGGWFVLTENLPGHASVRVAHQLSRRADRVSALLAEAEFDVVATWPQFVWMNYPLDTTSRLRQLAWQAMVAPCTVAEWYGFALGALLAPIERRLIASRRHTCSTKVLLCRAR